MIKAYHRPASIDEALRLLSRTGIHTAVLSSRSLVDARLDDTVDEVVDLQAVGLRQIIPGSAGLTVEALVTLQHLVEMPSLTQTLREVIHAEDSYSMRNMRTISSVILSADCESQLLAALLACDAIVTVQDVQGRRQVSLGDFLDDTQVALAGGLITAVTLQTDGRMAASRVARTPADKPIVAAAARRLGDGTLRAALSGVASVPVLVDPAEVDRLSPPGDFRGSSAYRLDMAKVLMQRVLGELESAS
ncbi:MAG: FAD binding domain-containing protein [Anaerolineae bacterium]|nr:FAD binding domain-containing protein [Anaerolineae bacterium]